MVGEMGEAAHKNQRGGDRITINKEFDSFDAFVGEYVTNLSSSGAFVRTKSPLPVGTDVFLHFTVVSDDLLTIEGNGRVVRVQQDPPGMGVVFTELKNASAELLQKLLTRQP